MWHQLCDARISVRLEPDYTGKGHFGRSIVLRHHHIVAYVGLFGRYERTATRNAANVTDSLRANAVLVIHDRLPCSGRSTVFEWCFVSFFENCIL